jgi:hypothetical protein
MDNLYGGFLYACLTVAIPPTVPNTISELVDSNLWGITTSYSYNSKYYSYHSLLKEVAIPDIISSWTHEHEYSKLLAKLNKRIVLFKTVYIDDRVAISKNISKFLPLSNRNNESISTKDSFAIIDPESGLIPILECIKILEKRYIVTSNDETHLEYIELTMGQNNFLSLYIKKGFQQLAESGISEYWKKIRQLRVNFRTTYLLGKEYGVKYLAKFMSNARDPIIFSEAETVSLRVMKYVIIFCNTVAISLGGLFLILELWRSGDLLVIVKNLYIRILFILNRCKKVVKNCFIQSCKCKSANVKVEQIRIGNDAEIVTLVSKMNGGRK